MGVGPSSLKLRVSVVDVHVEDAPSAAPRGPFGCQGGKMNGSGVIVQVCVTGQWASENRAWKAACGPPTDGERRTPLQGDLAAGMIPSHLPRNLPRYCGSWSVATSLQALLRTCLEQ
jgi:hypothetical protein